VELFFARSAFELLLAQVDVDVLLQIALLDEGASASFVWAFEGLFIQVDAQVVVKAAEVVYYLVAGFSVEDVVALEYSSTILSMIVNAFLE